jgi:hypothetical protein
MNICWARAFETKHLEKYLFVPMYVGKKDYFGLDTKSIESVQLIFLSLVSIGRVFQHGRTGLILFGGGRGGGGGWGGAQY